MAQPIKHPQSESAAHPPGTALVKSILMLWTQKSAETCLKITFLRRSVGEATATCVCPSTTYSTVWPACRRHAASMNLAETSWPITWVSPTPPTWCRLNIADLGSGYNGDWTYIRYRSTPFCGVVGLFVGKVSEGDEIEWPKHISTK